MKLWLRYLVFLTIISTLLFLYSIYASNERIENKEDRVDEEIQKLKSYLNVGQIRYLTARSNGGKIPFKQCSMSRCFNYSLCLRRPLKVYVYPTDADVIISPVYEKILRAIRDSSYYTDDPKEACLFILSLDTTDRDRLSDNYIKDLNARIELLPKDVWNEGRNHLIFNLYYGSYPDYSQRDIGFSTKNAIMAWASADSRTFRHGFDISFPLFHMEHPLRVGPQRIHARNPLHDQHLSSFKGKRYVYGIGSSTRDSLRHLHNRNSTIILTTCKHNTDWKRFEDSRCEQDNREYDNYDYMTLLGNSSFCLTPRGRRLGSFRFLESLKAGCIPVILSDEWELPFSERVNWAHAAIQFHERAVFFTTDALNSISSQRVARMKLHAQLIYHRYFASVEKIVLSSIQIIFDRLQFSRQSNDASSSTKLIGNKSSKFNVMIHATKRASNRVPKLIDLIAELSGIEKFIVLWPKARGTAPEPSAFKIRQAVDFVEVNDLDQENLLNLPNDHLHQADFLLFVDERVKLTRTQVKRLMETIQKWPDRLVTYHALRYVQQMSESANQTLTKGPNFVVKVPSISSKFSSSHSIGLLHLAAVHRSFINDYQNRTTTSIALKHVANSIPQCPALLFNIHMVERTLKAPIWLMPDNMTMPVFVEQNLKHYGQCLNKIIRAGYEENNAPLMSSNLRHL